MMLSPLFRGLINLFARLPPRRRRRRPRRRKRAKKIPHTQFLSFLSLQYFPPFFCARGEGKKKCVGGQGAGGGRQMIFSPMLILFFRGGCFAIKTRGRRRRRAKHSRTTVLQL